MSLPAPGTAVTARRIGLLTSLYFSQGLPYGFFTQALPLLLRKSGYSLGAIGLSSLLAAPWALKFLWAPIVDRFGSQRFGRRRSWILPLQVITALVLAGLAARAPDESSAVYSVEVLLGAVFVLNFLAATQDIATDGLAVDMLAPGERGLANGVQVGGYRAGMVAGGGVLLVFFERLGWASTFGAMALLIVVASVPVVLFDLEPRQPRAWTHASVQTATRTSAPHFLRRPGALRVLALVVTYKTGEAFASGMLRPFLADRGLGLADVGELVGTAGFLAGLVGALAGGALVSHLGRKRALVAFGVLQALSVATYAVAAGTDISDSWLWIFTALEHLTSGMGTAALFTAMMDWCLPGSSATDYTVQASAVVVATGLAASLSGFSAQALGYTLHFGVATLLALVAIAAAAFIFPTRAPGSPEEAS